MEETTMCATPPCDSVPEKVLLHQKNRYLISQNGFLFEVFEYLRFDQTQDPSMHKIVAYHADSCEEVLDKSVYDSILPLFPGATLVTEPPVPVPESNVEW